MLEEFIIKDLRETEESFFVAGSDGKETEILKKDLGPIDLAVGNLITIIKHPGFPGIAAGLDLSGHRVFHKSREEVADDWSKNWKKRLLGGLPNSAKHLLKMFEMFMPEFRTYELVELVALYLGWNLYQEVKTEKLIVNFVKITHEAQLMILPALKNNLLPSVPAERIALAALAFAHDEEKKITCEKVTDLPLSSVMSLTNATAERYGEFCKPRANYIAKYMAAITQ